jgi:hypothetical protein
MQDFEMEEEALMEAIKLYVKQKEMDCKITAKDDDNCYSGLVDIVVSFKSIVSSCYFSNGVSIS